MTTSTVLAPLFIDGTDAYPTASEVLPQMHALAIEDASVFLRPRDNGTFDWKSPDWDVDRITRVMDKFQTTGSDQHHPVIVVGAPNVGSLLTRKFRKAWNQWAQNRREAGIAANFVIRVIGEHTEETFLLEPSGTGLTFVAELRFYIGSYFHPRDIVPDASTPSGRRTIRMRLLQSDPWREILASIPDFGLDLNGWDSRHDCTLPERFYLDHAVVSVSSVYDGSDALSLVTIVSANGVHVETGTIAVERVNETDIDGYDGVEDGAR